jgi:hypothetical protein
MESATLRRWLARRGCRFYDSEPHTNKRRGIAKVTIHRGNRIAVLPLIGSRKRLEPRVVKQIVEALGLTWSELPGAQGRINKRRLGRAQNRP